MWRNRQLHVLSEDGQAITFPGNWADKKSATPTLVNRVLDETIGSGARKKREKTNTTSRSSEELSDDERGSDDSEMDTTGFWKLVLAIRVTHFQSYPSNYMCPRTVIPGKTSRNRLGLHSREEALIPG